MSAGLKWTALALLLASCGQPKNDQNICGLHENPAPGALLKMPWSEKLDICLDKWAYRLAKSEEPSTVVAAATLGGCNDALNSAIADKIGENTAVFISDYNAAVEIARKSGEARPDWRDYSRESPKETELALTTRAKGRALFSVVQARAGKCDAP